MRHGIPNLGALQAFEATARLGSFSRAAEELNLTHSAVYRQVVGLEERLGVQLFTRVRRRVTLTQPGAEYAGRVRHHLEQLEKDTFGLVSRSGMGRSLHIAVVPTLATTWLVPKLVNFQRLHADISISLSVRTLPFQFSDHPFDAAIYHAVQPWSQTTSIKLFDEQELIAVCAPTLFRSGPAGEPAAGEQDLSKGGTPDVVSPDRVAPDRVAPDRVSPNWIHLHMISRPEAWRNWYQAQGRDYLPVMSAGPRYELFSIALAAAEHGMGVALVPRFLASAALDSGALVQADPGVLTASEAYYFGYPTHKECSEALRHFESWLASLSQEKA
jgi:LysR family glycine cleavage system transcriptional activator